MRGVTSRITPRFVYWIWEPPVVFAVPGVRLMMGEARETDNVAVSLSSVTVRGSDRTFASEFWLINESTACIPSAFRNPMAGDRPLRVLAEKPLGIRPPL